MGARFGIPTSCPPAKRDGWSVFTGTLALSPCRAPYVLTKYGHGARKPESEKAENTFGKMDDERKKNEPDGKRSPTGSIRA